MRTIPYDSLVLMTQNRLSVQDGKFSYQDSNRSFGDHQMFKHVAAEEMKTCTNEVV